MVDKGGKSEMPALPSVILGAETVFAGAGMANPSVIMGGAALFQAPDGSMVAVSAANPLPVVVVSAGAIPAGQFVPVSATMPLPTVS